ncbi:hypothetical protein GTP58_20155 [Duganella sp. CY15W]|uniref:hypothetical protein n=1 Tax=Duganella sp. CY15W TaxID=2692172 RepID=UPI00136DBCCF|nr:hypothetical protein [Duganella sp. CY15W]MYM30649.1 hypothetical protein [Duganella sp. CY15W]
MNRKISQVCTWLVQRMATAVSAVAVGVTICVTPAAHATPSIGYWFDYIPGTGQTDMVLTPDAISNAVRQGLRAGGIAATANSGNVDALVSVEMVESYEPQFNSLRIVSGTILLKVPRPGAGNFERPILLCVTSIQAWRTSSNTQEAARKVRDGIVQKAADFARECRPQLNNL